MYLAASNGAAGGGLVITLLVLALAVVAIVAQWKMFEKAGEPGWGCIIPIYNFYLMCKIGGKPGWWVLLMLIPFVNFVVLVLVLIGVAKGFGKGGGFALGMIVLPFVFFCLLGFGDATYNRSLAV